MNEYRVTGTFHGSIVYATSEGKARKIFHCFWSLLWLTCVPLSFKWLSTISHAGAVAQIFTLLFGLGIALFGLWLVYPIREKGQMSLPVSGNVEDRRSLLSTLSCRLGWDDARDKVSEWDWDGFWDSGFLFPVFILLPFYWFILWAPV